MKIKNKIYNIFLVLTFFIMFYSNCPKVHADTKPEKHILIINPFNQDYPASQLYIDGIKEVLEKNSEFKFTYSYEYADLARHSNDVKYIQALGDSLKIKYLKDQPDFIITTSNLYSFFSKYGNSIFPNVPMIINWDRDNIPSDPLPKNYIIIAQMPWLDQNIELILNTRPLTKKIYIVMGDSPDKAQRANPLWDIQNKYSDKVDIVILNNMTYSQMLEQIRNSESNSSILYFQWVFDSDGKSFIPVEVIKDISRQAKVPVYGISEQYVGNGIIGGYVDSHVLAGKSAGNSVLNALNGKNTSENQIIHAESRTYTFDWRELKKWNINEDLLPKDSVILYKDKTVWDLYKGYIIGTFILLILQLSLIFVLLFNRRQKIKAQINLIEANSSLQEMTSKLISMDKMKDEFLINTSHELQTPLNGIINISEALTEGKYGSINEKQEEELKLVLSISRRLSLLIRDILDFEKIERNDMKLNLKAINVKAASKLTVEVLRHLIQGKDVQILMKVPNNLPNVLADENRLLQILYNLIGNAIKFTKNGTITLTAKEENKYIKVTIEDTGIGISKEKQQNLFNAFSQASEAQTASEYSGSGLGLYISKQLLSRMNGHIFLEWSQLNKGTCISFLIPKTTESIPNMKQEPEILSKDTYKSENTENSIVSSKFKILAVDDELTNLRVLKAIFDAPEYEVLTTSNGMEAINLVNIHNDIDLVLMDVMMPGISGYEASRKIRERYSIYDLPLLLLTVRDTPEDIVMGFDSGANDFITKPFVAKELKARVLNLLQMKKSVENALKNEMAFLQSQIKPHFLYNAMSTIMSFCYTDGERAGELLGYLSEYLQKSFNIDNTDTTVSIQSELDLTKAYVEIEKARFGDRLKVEFNIDEASINQRILPLTIQPLVENSIRHGVMKRISGGTVKITVKKENNEIKVSVEDDGIGIENIEAIVNKLETSKAKDKKGGVGISNIRMRLMKYYGAELHLSSKINEGTKIHFSLSSL